MSEEELNAWTQYKQNYAVVMGDGPTGVANRVYGPWRPTNGIPFNLLIDRKTMEVLTVFGRDTYQDASDFCDKLSMP